MRDHEVPTHLQAEDRVLLWLTFPQIVAMVVVCALSYGVYRYAPAGPSQMKVAMAVLFGLFGIAMVVGKIGGRRLPLVVADLLRYRMGARRYLGRVSQLLRCEPPASIRRQPGPGARTLLAMGVRRGLRRLGGAMESARRRIRRRKRSGGDRRNGRMPFHPHRWFRKDRRQPAEGGNDAEDSKTRKSRRGKFPRIWSAMMAVVLGVTAVALPQDVLADEDWRNEIDFEILDPVPGRRLYVEGLTVADDKASVDLRAATDLWISVQAYGGQFGAQLVHWAAAEVKEGESVVYELPLTGPHPSFTFSWEDSLGQAGALSLATDQIPHPLPSASGEICDLRLTSLAWTSGAIEGVVESDCEDRMRKLIALPTVSGHVSVGEMSLMNADVTAVTGVVSAVTTGSRTAVPLVPNGETRLRLEVSRDRTVFPVFVVAEVQASLSISLPPLTRLTHHPERTEHRTTTVTLTRPGTSQTVSEKVTVEHEDGTSTKHTISATLSIPSREVLKSVTIPIVHPEHVKADVEQRNPAIRSLTETLDMGSSIGTDEPYRVLILPDRKPELPPSEQRPADSGEVGQWFEHFGWEWPW